MRMRLALVLGLMAMAPLARAQMGGMGGMGGSPPPHQGPNEDLIPEVDEKVGADAQRSFERGEQEFKAHNWLDAIAYYRHVTQKFAYDVPLAAKAELRLGDVAFEREKYAEARGYYKNFLRFHPRHEQADYAAFRVGLSSFKEIPGDLFIEPPSNEKDQTEVKTALAQMKDFQERYPNSPYVKDAKDVVAKCEDKLASHEMYVADFYEKREKWKAVVLRTEGLVHLFPESRYVPEALALAVEAHTKLGETADAQKDLSLLEATKDAKMLARARKYATEQPH